MTRIIAGILQWICLLAMVPLEIWSPGIGGDDQPQQAIWLSLALFVVFFVLSELMKPKPDVEDARPTPLELPTATEGRIVPVVWGTAKIGGPNIIWDGDLRLVPITESVKYSLIRKAKRYITGYEYFTGFQAALCRGGTHPVDEVRRIWVGDEVLWEGSLSSDADFVDIDEPEFLGGNDLGSGGIVGRLRFYSGSMTQMPDPYLAQHQSIGGNSSAYRGTCFMVFEQGWLGNNERIQPWAFEVRRIPNGLGLATAGVNDGYDANPMNVLYEIITNDEWGMGLPASDVNVANFTAAAQTLLTEGNGFSFALESPMPLNELIKEIERQIDGVVYLDRSTGQFHVSLARGGYDLGSMPELNASNIIEIGSFDRGSWEDTTNNVLVKFINRDREYQDTYAGAQDMANVRVQGNKIVSAEHHYPGVRDATLANQIAWRDLRLLSYPLARLNVTVDRTMHDTNPGDIRRFTDPDLGIKDMPMRVVSVDLGELDNGRIGLALSQDIFQYDDGVFAAPGATRWEPPAQDVVPIPVDESAIFEAPRAFVTRDDQQPGTFDRIWVGGRYQSDAATVIGIASRPNTGSYTDAGDVVDFLRIGSLDAAMDNTGGQGSISIVVDPGPSNLAQMKEVLETATAHDVGVGLMNLVKIGDEFFGFKMFSDDGSQLTLIGGYRGLLDSAPAPHDAGDDVVFLVGNLTDSSFAPGSTQNIKLLPRSMRSILDEGDATATDVVMSNRGRRPYPPVDLSLASSVYPSSVNIDTVMTGLLDGQGVRTDFTRRDFRTADETAAVVDEGSLPSDFPAANTTEYMVRMYDDAGVFIGQLKDWITGDGTAIDISRTRILRHTGGEILPSMSFGVRARHTFDGIVYESRLDAEHTFGVTSTLDDEFNLGVVGYLDLSNIYPLPVPAGTLVLDVGAALPAGDVEARVNNDGVLDGGAAASSFTGEVDGGEAATATFDAVRTGGFASTTFGLGAWETVITAATTSGTFDFEEDDAVQFRHQQNTDDDVETFFRVRLSGSAVAYGILTY